ncbi:hypothetical protein EDF46_0851 [Frondihabitans sp. PhB188]|uniref:hypothetical protein n=1 Tax=Frondihabitans sp. PhB188 TaxID=2485200 RepID=UPI000F461088|nr:hypothetical protein [Frondihabitans sp. PhB188]ROQ41472.1 hypothetical protein EDF46_0851 [Frondihabitans sp. PhB188]
MKKVNRVSVAAGIVLGSLSIGLGATPVVAAPAPSTTTAVVSTASSVTPIGSPSGIAADLRIPADTPEPSKSSRGRIPIGPIISFIKKAGVAIWKACVKAAKAGWSKTVAWWNSLASWVRSGIKFLANASATEILSRIVDWVLTH